MKQQLTHVNTDTGVFGFRTMSRFTYMICSYIYMNTILRNLKQMDSQTDRPILSCAVLETLLLPTHLPGTDPDPEGGGGPKDKCVCQRGSEAYLR